MKLFINAGSILAALLLSFRLSNALAQNLKLPDGFSIGAATAAYQTEGGWNDDGKGESIWDEFVHRKPSPIRDNSTGDVACDSYHKYEEDIKVLKEIGLNHYRFSISWVRILPDGKIKNINQKGLEYYHKLIDRLIAEGIEPYVTIYHWDHPHSFEEFGGWTNETIVTLFADYARLIFQEFGSKVKVFTTINEPLIFCTFGYGSNVFPPAMNKPARGEYLCVHNTLKAHATAYHIYNNEFRPTQNGKIGIAQLCNRFFAHDENDRELEDLGFQFTCGWTSDPIFSKTGDYPKEFKAIIANNSKAQGLSESRLPSFSEDWITKIKGSADFFAINHYSSVLLKKGPGMKGPFFADLDINFTFNSSWEKTSNVWFHVVPHGMRSILNEIRIRYDNPEVYIMENGMLNPDPLNDTKRVNFFEKYLKAVLEAVYEDKCNVKSYTIWSLFDVFEWRNGYRNNFGIVNVDFNEPMRNRTLKLSARWFKKVLEKRSLENITLNDL